MATLREDLHRLLAGHPTYKVSLGEIEQRFNVYKEAFNEPLKAVLADSKLHADFVTRSTPEQQADELFQDWLITEYLTFGEIRYLANALMREPKGEHTLVHAATVAGELRGRAKDAGQRAEWKWRNLPEIMWVLRLVPAPPPEPE